MEARCAALLTTTPLTTAGTALSPAFGHSLRRCSGRSFRRRFCRLIHCRCNRGRRFGLNRLSLCLRLSPSRRNRLRLRLSYHWGSYNRLRLGLDPFRSLRSGLALSNYRLRLRRNGLSFISLDLGGSTGTHARLIATAATALNRLRGARGARRTLYRLRHLSGKLCLRLSGSNFSLFWDRLGGSPLGSWDRLR